jgi:Signal transduction histidine kinase regulating citrate/malate metabolism
VKIPKVFRKRSRRSIRRRLILIVTGVHGILMVSLMTDVVQRQQTFLMDKAHSQIMRQAELLAASTAPQLITNDLAGLDDILTSIRRDAAVQWAAVTDRQGMVKGDSDRSRQGKYYVDDTSRAVLGGKTSRMIRETDSMLSAAAPVTVDGEILGWAWISRDLSDERAQIAQIRQTGYLYTMFAILGGALLSAILATRSRGSSGCCWREPGGWRRIASICRFPW